MDTTNQFWSSEEEFTPHPEDISPIIDNKRLVRTDTFDQLLPYVHFWIWEGWIAQNRLTVLIGARHSGRTTLIADVAARLSANIAFPGAEKATSESRNILWLGDQDEVRTTLKQNLIAGGGDLSRFERAPGYAPSEAHSWSPYDAIGVAADKVNGAEENGNKYGLVVIDPLTSLLQEHGKKFNVKDAARALDIIGNFAAATRTAILISIDAPSGKPPAVTSFASELLRATTCKPIVCKLIDEGHSKRRLIQCNAEYFGIVGNPWILAAENVKEGHSTVHVGTTLRWSRQEAPDEKTTPNGSAGMRENQLAEWIRYRFSAPGAMEGLRVSDVRREALAADVCSQRSWEEKSQIFLEKRNKGGVWYCRPRQ